MKSSVDIFKYLYDKPKEKFFTFSAEDSGKYTKKYQIEISIPGREAIRFDGLDSDDIWALRRVIDSVLKG